MFAKKINTPRGGKQALYKKREKREMRKAHAICDHFFTNEIFIWLQQCQIK